jgi:hypothetical protein
VERCGAGGGYSTWYLAVVFGGDAEVAELDYTENVGYAQQQMGICSLWRSCSSLKSELKPIQKP